MANTSESATWLSWFKELAGYLLLFVIPVWKLIDAYFAYQSKKDQEFIKTIVTETLKVALQEIKEDVRELKENRLEDMKEFNSTVRDIYKEIKK